MVKSKYWVRMQHTRMRFVKTVNKKQLGSIMQKEHLSVKSVDLSKRALLSIWRKKIEILHKKTQQKKLIVEPLESPRLIKWTTCTPNWSVEVKILDLTSETSQLECERKVLLELITRRKRETGSKIGSKQCKESFT